MDSYPSVPKLFGVVTGMAIFATAGFFPAFADSGTQAVPLPPRDLNATAVSDTQITLTWNPPINATQSGVTGYQIQRNGTVIANDTENNQTIFNDTGLLPGSQEEYQVAAWNSSGLGLLSNFALATTEILQFLQQIQIRPILQAQLKLQITRSQAQTRPRQL